MNEELDAVAAAELMDQAVHHALDELSIKQPRLYLTWGVAWLTGLGAVWLSVRGQHPYRGPSAPALVTLVVLFILAIAASVLYSIQAGRGVGGVSRRQGAIFGLAWSAGFGALGAIENALAHAGASRTVSGLIAVAGPLLVTGLIYLVSSAIWLDGTMAAIGAWLLVVGAAGSWAGPVWLALISALAGGSGFLTAAAYLTYRRRAERQLWAMSS